MIRAMRGDGAYDENSDYQKRSWLSYETLLWDAGRQVVVCPLRLVPVDG